MTASNDAFRRISPLMRTMRIALTVSDTACVLMDDVRIEKRPDGTVAMRYDRREGVYGGGFDPHPMIDGSTASEMVEAWSPFGHTVSANWVLSRVSARANRIWYEMLTDEERRAIRDESTRHDDAGDKFIARVMRRLIGYRHTAQNAASLCSLAIARMLDPEMVKALRHICGWNTPDPFRVIQDWDRIDAHGRQIGLKGRPVQVACLARLIARYVQRDTEGNVGILSMMPETRARCERDDAAYMESTSDIEHPSISTTSQVEDLCEIADLLPSVLRSAGVKPSFWRMALRMRPSQILAMRDLFVGEWSDLTSRTLNTLTLIGEDLLPPTLIRQICRSIGHDRIRTEIRLVIARRAAEAIATRQRRQSLRDATAKIEEVCDHLDHRLDALVEEVLKDRDYGATTDPTERWEIHMRNVREREERILSLLPRILPRNRPWAALVAESDAWHEESLLALDEGDSRTWTPLLTAPVRSGAVEIVELHTAAELRAESRELKHCVGTGGYAGRCMQGETRILSLAVMGRRTRSTMEISLSEGRWTSVQHRGRSNSVPKPMLLAATADALRAVNRAQKALDSAMSPLPLAA